MKMTKDNKGITLIALVLTIIVLLILAGITIGTISGKNGIWTKAKESKAKNEIAQAKEEVELAFQALKIKEKTKKLSEEERLEILQNELEKAYPEQTNKSTVSILENIYPVEHKGYKFEVNEKYEVSYIEAFDPQKWDINATDEACFVWEGNTIVGYNSEPLIGVTSIRIPSRCTAIRSDFYTAWDGYRNYVGGIARVEIPETVTEIGDAAFLGFDAMKSITIPDSVTILGSDVFMNCTNLANVKLSKNLKTIGNRVFGTYGSEYPKCESLKSIVIPDSVESIGAYAFYECYNLESVTLPKNLKKIPDDAFSNCGSLKEVKNIENVEIIGNSAFLKCRNLVLGKLPENLKQIGQRAFESCKLGKVIIPESVITIGQRAFKGACSNPIYCRISSKPEGWAGGWNRWYTDSDDDDYNYDVVWGYTGE